jgi:hypothetical protein
VSRIAVDIVLLPEADMSERAIAINRSLVEKHDSDIVLDPAHCLPHVSLAMGCIRSDALQAIASDLKSVIGGHPVKQLYVKHLTSQSHHGGSVVSSIALQAREDLQQLHIQVMRALGPYFSREVTESMFTGEHPIASSTLNWVKNFPEQSSGKNFLPHITLGYGPCAQVELPPAFAPEALAVCHLGNHCTCRKVLCRLPCQ